MPETTTETRAEKEAQERTRYREQQASIVLGLRTILEEDEQLLGFARGRISGGWRGKLAVGPEAFFAPYVNIGLTERRLFLQHIHPEDGKLSEIPPHTFMLADVDSITFSGIETFGQNEEGRMTIRQTDDQYFRIRLAGGNNTQDANALVEVFRSLTKSRRDPKPSPTQRVCGCGKETFDREYKFCPYCGLKQLGMRIEPAPPPAYTPPPTPRSPPARWQGCGRGPRAVLRRPRRCRGDAWRRARRAGAAARPSLARGARGEERGCHRPRSRRRSCAERARAIETPG